MFIKGKYHAMEPPHLGEPYLGLSRSSDEVLRKSIASAKDILLGVSGLVDNDLLFNGGFVKLSMLPISKPSI